VYKAQPFSNFNFKVMTFNSFMGIDISKKTLDLCLLSSDNAPDHCTIENNTTAIEHHFTKVINAATSKNQKILFVMEHTGIYNEKIAAFLEKRNQDIWQCNPNEIIRSNGLQRGKTDKVDALRIAQYAMRNIDKYRPHIPMREELTQIKRLFAVRRNLVKSRKQVKALCQDYDFLNPKLISIEKKSVSQAILALDRQIDNIEEEIKHRVLNDPFISRLYMIITSIMGISFVTAVKIIIATNEFKKITSAKALSCHAGVAPFQHTSGTSLKGQTKVSHIADKELKSLLHMSAVAAIAHPGELRNYYLRKVEQGKHKMKVINNVRNKLVHRVFACVKNNRIYQKNYNNCLTLT
jgi:transposase